MANGTVTLVFADAESGKPLRITVSRKNVVAHCQVIADMLNDMGEPPRGELALGDTLSRSAAMLFVAAMNNAELLRIARAHLLFTPDMKDRVRLAHWNAAALAYKYGFNMLIGFYTWAFAHALGQHGRSWFAVTASHMVPESDQYVPTRERAAVQFATLAYGNNSAQDALACSVCSKTATGTCSECNAVPACSGACLAAVHGTCFSFHFVPEVPDASTQGVPVHLLDDTTWNEPIRDGIVFLASLMTSRSANAIDDVIKRLTEALPEAENRLLVGAAWKSFMDFCAWNYPQHPMLMGAIANAVLRMPKDARAEYVPVVDALVRQTLEKYIVVSDAVFLRTTMQLASFATVQAVVDRPPVARARTWAYVREAVEANRLDVVQYLFQRTGFQPVEWLQFLPDAAHDGALEVLDFLLGELENVDEKRLEEPLDNVLLDALGRASANGHVHVVQRLLPKIRRQRAMLFAEALNQATQHGFWPTVKVLLEDARVDPSDNNFWAVSLAITYTQDAVLQVLLEDPRINILANGARFVSYAKEMNNMRAVRMIQQEVKNAKKKKESVYVTM